MNTIAQFVSRLKSDKLFKALSDPIWQTHKLGDKYSMTNIGGADGGIWSIAYYPLFGTFRQGQWVEYNEPRALIERPINNGIDLREIPIHFLKRI
jgi:hypothetical protein